MRSRLHAAWLGFAAGNLIGFTIFVCVMMRRNRRLVSA